MRREPRRRELTERYVVTVRHMYVYCVCASTLIDIVLERAVYVKLKSALVRYYLISARISLRDVTTIYLGRVNIHSIM